MNDRKLTRREALARTGLFAGGALLLESLGVGEAPAQTESTTNAQEFRFCLNTATIRGHKLGIVKEIEVVAAAALIRKLP